MADFDLIVIGAGAAGLGTARAARGHGARVLMMSDEEPGGDCTWHGCVPSKTLIESAKHGDDFETAMRSVRDAIGTIAATEDAGALHGEGIAFRRGRARLVGPDRIDVDGDVVSASRCVIATGSRPAVPPIPGLDIGGHLTTDTVFDLSTRPRSLAVIGGGAVGCELAQAFARLGCRVEVIEAADRLLSGEDPEASRVVAEVLGREDIAVHTGKTVTRVDNDTGKTRLVLSDGDTVDAECLLVAAGRTPATAGLGLADVGVPVDERGFIVTDSRMATAVPGVYAAGDVTGRMPFTHAAFAMGRVAAANAVGRKKQRYDSRATPRVTFTDPEVAHVGLTEAEAVGRGGRVAFLPMSEMDRAITAGETDGFIKLVAGPRKGFGNLGGGRILGATIVGSRAGEMIHQPALAMATGMFAGRLAQATTAYPTWSYGVQLAAGQFFTEIGGRRARPAGSGGSPTR